LLSNNCRAKIKLFDFDFSTQDIKGRGAGGNIMTKYPIKKIQLKAEGRSTLGGVDIYYDEAIGRLNRDSRGRYLGNFNSTDSILAVNDDGSYEITSFELTNRYDIEHLKYLEKFNPEVVLTAIYLDGSSKLSYIKKFKIETTTLNKKFIFISESRGSKLLFITSKSGISLEVLLKKKKSNDKEVLLLDELVSLKGWKAQGNRLSTYPVLKLHEISDEGDDVETRVNDETSISELKENDEVVFDADEPNEEETNISPDKPQAGKQDEPESDESENGYHAGDTIEMKIDLQKLKKNKDQLGLFDD
jgi:topoisomerase IV subunit A